MSESVKTHHSENHDITKSTNNFPRQTQSPPVGHQRGHMTVGGLIFFILQPAFLKGAILFSDGFICIAGESVLTLYEHLWILQQKFKGSQILPVSTVNSRNE